MVQMHSTSALQKIMSGVQRHRTKPSEEIGGARLMKRLHKIN